MLHGTIHVAADSLIERPASCYHRRDNRLGDHFPGIAPHRIENGRLHDILSAAKKAPQQGGFAMCWHVVAWRPSIIDIRTSDKCGPCLLPGCITTSTVATLQCFVLPLRRWVPYLLSTPPFPAYSPDLIQSVRTQPRTLTMTSLRPSNGSQLRRISGK